MNINLMHTIWLAASFLVLFGLAELLYHKYMVRAEHTRKFIHFGTGLLTLLFPVFLSSHWWVLLLCSSFALLLFASIRFNLLKSINAVEHVTWGSLYFPAAVYGCFLVYEYGGAQVVLFYLPILILAICDTLAALVGRKWPIGKFSVFGNTKTLSGSLAFAVSAFIITIPFYATSHERTMDMIGISFSIALTSSIAEAISNKGIDNLLIPASVVILAWFFL